VAALRRRAGGSIFVTCTYGQARDKQTDGQRSSVHYAPPYGAGHIKLFNGVSVHTRAFLLLTPTLLFGTSCVSHPQQPISS